MSKQTSALSRKAPASTELEQWHGAPLRAATDVCSTARRYSKALAADWVAFRCHLHEACSWLGAVCPLCSTGGRQALSRYGRGRRCDVGRLSACPTRGRQTADRPTEPLGRQDQPDYGRRCTGRRRCVVDAAAPSNRPLRPSAGPCRR